MSTATTRRRLAELETALAQITRPASLDEMSWIKWTTNAELDEMEALFGNLQSFEDLDDLAKLRVIEVVAAATRREMAAAEARERGDLHSPDLHIPREG